MVSKETKVTRSRAFIIIFLCASVLCGVSIFLPFASVQEIEYRTWDWRLQLIADPPSATPVRIITIDQSSLDYLARNEKLFWPWPRGVYEAVLRYLERAGAKAVAFDILFTEPSSWGVDDDEAFAAAVKGSIPVVNALAMQQAVSGEDPTEIELFFNQQAATQALLKPVTVPAGAVLPFAGITLPVHQLIEHSTLLGDVEGRPDSDGIFRHTVPAARLESRPESRVLRLPFALYALAFPNGHIDLTSQIDPAGRLAVRFAGPKGSMPTESFANIFLSWQNILAEAPPLVPLANYKDAIVLVGMDAPGLLDLRPTPLSSNFPGVELNATILQNIIDQSFIRKPTDLQVFVGTAVLLLLVAAATIFLSGGAQGLSCGLLFGGFFAGGLWAAHLGWWVPLVIPFSGMALSLLASLAFLFGSEGRQKRFIKEAFRYYVSPSIIDRIVEDPRQLELGGERRELTIFFSDIAGFTSISESIGPGQLVPLLNTYLTAVTDVILRHGGTVDKYVGDAVVAFWNAPVALPDHAACGVAAALEIQRELTRLQAVFESEYKVTVKTRIGLNTGQVSVGNFGSIARFSYTVIGDAANIASRLEGANKSFGTPILISERTYLMLNGTQPCRPVGTVRVLGKSSGVAVYEPLEEQHVLRRSPEKLRSYLQALELFQKGASDDAKRLFETLPEDYVSAAYLRRIAKEEGKARDDWTPEWTLTEK